MVGVGSNTGSVEIEEKYCRIIERR